MALFRRLLDFILPAQCSYCSAPAADSPIPFFCTDCWSDFAVIAGPVCDGCGRPFESPETLTHSAGHVCVSCRQLPHKFDQALSVGYFEGPLREAIHQFKYRPCRSLAKPLVDWMSAKLQPIEKIDFVIPVPLHRTRLRQRGFNQALLLASGIGARFGIPLNYDNLVRLRATRPQVELSAEERKKNVAGAFSVIRARDLNNKNVLLVDDVFTSGSTLNECAGVLKSAGAAHVTALTVARAT